LILYVYFRCYVPQWTVIAGDILTLRHAERCYVTRAGESVVFVIVITQLLVVAHSFKNQGDWVSSSALRL
jgi:hypothetical protein